MKFMRFMRLRIYFLAIFFYTLGCGASKSHDIKSGPLSVETALGQIYEIERGITEGYLLSDSGNAAEVRIKQALYDLKLLLFRIKQDPDDEKALNLLYQNYQIAHELPIQVYDQESFLKLFKSIHVAIEELSRLAGVNITGFLFRETFEGGLGSFTQVKNFGLADFEVNEDYLRVSGHTKGANDIWLISPRIDLQLATDPHLEVRQTMAYFTKWSDMQILISKDFKGGDPSKAKWEELPIQRRPDEDKRWRWVTSEKISLQEYQKTPFVIGFRYQSSVKKATTWQIDHLKIYGKGSAIKTPLF